ncbi:MAG: hypothetical protein KDJ24_16650 [Gammaproteobacteria bacterium]|nr:hypothetical protein [Gammaproteobacteria bacterium]
MTGSDNHPRVLPVRNGFAGMLAALLLGTPLLGCESAPGRDTPVRPRAFAIDNIAKADVDMVAEINVQHSMDYLRELARKLYVRNPNQLLRSGFTTREQALKVLFQQGAAARFTGLQGSRSSTAIALAFDERYVGDRVAAYIYGLSTMLIDGYGGKSTFYISDTLDPQKLYYLARNIEIAFWKLGHDRNGKGELYLLSNSLDGSGDLSFERIAGKLIGLQDHMAQVVADSSNRQIKNVIQGVASAVFFPI